MRFRSLFLGAVIAALVGGTMSHGVGVAAHPGQSPIEGNLSLVFQSVVPPQGSAWRPDDVATLASTAATWVHAASDGRLTVSNIHVAEATQVPSTTCRDLARTVALSRTGRDVSPKTRHIYLGQAHDCPYLGLAETPGTWIILPSSGASISSSARTLVHELGHTLGLAHAGAQTCPVMVSSALSDTENCGVDAYGDYTDPLGRGSVRWGLNVLNRENLGWGDGVTEISGDGRHRVTLVPVTAHGPDGIRVTDPVGGDTYVVSYRAPGRSDGLDRNLTSVETGVYLHRLPRTNERGMGSVLLPWIGSTFQAHGGKKNYTYLAPGGGFMVRIRSVSRSQASIEVHLSQQGGLKNVAGPVFESQGPSLSRSGKAVLVRIPRAWDQAGIDSYSVTVNGRVVWRSAANHGMTSHAIRLSSRDVRSRTVFVRVTNSLGNTTVVRLR
jgi:hypothetical protein